LILFSTPKPKRFTTITPYSSAGSQGALGVDGKWWGMSFMRNRTGDEEDVPW